jgi:outer membrane protein
MSPLRAIIALAVLGCAGPLWAAEDVAPETASEPVQAFTIAVIDPNRVVEESPQYEQARQTLSAEVAEREAELVDQQESVDRLNDKLDRDGALMSEEELKRLQNDIRARNRRLRYAKAELQEDFALRQSELRTKLVKQVEEVVRQIAREKDIDLIVSEGVVYFSDRIDISADVIERLTEVFNKR